MDKENLDGYKNLFKRIIDVDKEIVFFCIGTDRVMGDCVGPIIGSLLRENYGQSMVYGDLENNVTYENIETTLNEINEKFENPYIIAIDAALSTSENVGKIFVDNNGISFGNSLGKNFNKIGDLGIKVVVGKDYNNPDLNFNVLQNVSLSEIIKLSKKTFDRINFIMNK
ncbi:MAG: spore protease YyaC [Clostridia bacterium]|nr:spore protease YyaC [Clostridia bacterium]